MQFELEANIPSEWSGQFAPTARACAMVESHWLLGNVIEFIDTRKPGQKLMRNREINIR